MVQLTSISSPPWRPHPVTQSSGSTFPKRRSKRLSPVSSHTARSRPREPLSRGRSFNNRIYFPQLRLGSPDSEGQGLREDLELVLKVNGRYFGADKIQNEVGCLWLLEKYCSRVPAPTNLCLV